MSSAPTTRGAGAVRRLRPALAVGVVALAACVAGAFASPTSSSAPTCSRSSSGTASRSAALAVLMLQYLTGGAWGIAIRRELEAATRTIPLRRSSFLPIAPRPAPALRVVARRRRGARRAPPEEGGLPERPLLRRRAPPSRSPRGWRWRTS